LKWKYAIGALIVIAFAGLLLWRGHLSQLDQIAEVKIGPIALVFIATVLLMALSALKWWLLVSGIHPDVSFPPFDFFRVVVIGATVGMVIPQDLAAISSRVTYLRGIRSLSLENSTYSVLLDRWLDLIALLLLVPVSILYVVGFLGLWAALLSNLALMLLLIFSSAFWPSITTLLFTRTFNLLNRVYKFIFRRKKSYPSAINSTIDQNSTGDRAILILMLSFARVAVVGARALFAMWAIGIDFDIFKVLAIVPISQLALIIPITPGGIGIYDASWYGLLTLGGVTPTEGILFVLLHRILIIISLVGLLVLTEVLFVLRKLFLKVRLNSRRGNS
jgi:uncharacterized protein (TIRG00374 family)